jgi:hypothetical protein
MAPVDAIVPIATILSPRLTAVGGERGKMAIRAITPTALVLLTHGTDTGKVLFLLVVLGPLTCGFDFAANPFSRFGGHKTRIPPRAQVLCGWVWENRV